MSIILLLLAITFVSLLISLFKLISTFKIREKRKINILTFLILLLPLIVTISIRNYETQQEKILFGYSDGVVSSADIIFYESNKMKYCSSSLIGTECYFGKYKQNKDTFYVTYSDKLPSIRSTKLTRLDNKLLFLGEDDSIEHEFYIGNKYLLEKN